MRSLTTKDGPKEELRELLAHGCPKCGGELSRIRRRPVDIMMSAIVPLRRVRCRNIHCQYEGNLRP